MPQTKIQGKFYPLQHEEFIKLNKRLTQSELAVYLWLKTNDPFGDKLVEASTKQIADDLNVSRRTVQRALVKLRNENLIDLIITKFQYRVKSCPAEDTSEKKIKETLRVATPGSPSDTSVAIGTGMSPSVQECRHRYENVAISTGMSPPTAETQSEQQLENPKTLKTYSDFKKTLSEDEREKFFNFVEEKIKNLEKPINDLEAWLASQNAAKQNRWEVYYSNYQEQKKCAQSRTNKQNQGSVNLNLAKRQNVIAKFQERMGIKQPIDEEPSQEEVNSQEYQQKLAEFNKLLDNPHGSRLSTETAESALPPEREKVELQQHREKIAEFKRQEEEIRRANREAAEERAKQQNSDVEQRKAEIRRQLEEFNQRQQSQNPENTSEINLENLEDE
jgi:DNA-binding transcriptional ArsR family regulator